MITLERFSKETAKYIFINFIYNGLGNYEHLYCNIIKKYLVTSNYIIIVFLMYITLYRFIETFNVVAIIRGKDKFNF